MNLKISEFDYDLPLDRIAQSPVSPRDHSKLLVVNRTPEKYSHTQFFNLPEILKAGDTLVLNDSKVLPARLMGKADGKNFEVFLLNQTQENPITWTCLVRPGKKIKNETTIFFGEKTIGTVSRLNDQSFQIQFPELSQNNFLQTLQTIGTLPLPPYVKRPIQKTDTYDYQTVYAEPLGSIAAPTAGLHFTQDLLQKIAQKEVRILKVTLHVGYGTFAPIRSENISDHKMHFESYSVSTETLRFLNEAKKNRSPVIAVGTTAARVLESIDTYGLSGKTDLFIQPGYAFKRVDGILTNFHLPKTSLFVLVSAFLGLGPCKRAYSLAIEEKYRFYSYGDAMLICPPQWCT